jgi:hypothetical protein
MRALDPGDPTGYLLVGNVLGSGVSSLQIPYTVPVGHHRSKLLLTAET